MGETPKIEVIGNAKTGTTGVFNSIRAPLRERHPDTLLLFEPRSSALYRLARHRPPFAILVKAMVNKNGTKIAHHGFTHHVLITRDPRDTLVSHLLYLPLQPQGVRAGAAKLDQYLQLLQEKEADPASHSFREIYERSAALLDHPNWSWDKYMDRFAVALQLRDAYEFFVLRYEDFTDNRLDALSAYVELPVEPVKPKRLDDQNAHVVRSATHGDWRNWFLPSDVEFFRPMMREYMDRFAYDDDWSLAPSPVVPSATGSEYVRTRRPVVEQKMERRFERPAAWHLRDVRTVDDAEAIRAIAQDSGAGVYGFRYASLLLDGGVVPRDPERAFEFAYRSALVGHLPAMELVARMYREGLGVTADARQASVWDDEAAKLRAPPPLPPEQQGRLSATLVQPWRRLRRYAGRVRRLGLRTRT
jgi:hypothetical protein